MNYFAYGSNMSLQRLRERLPDAEYLGSHTLINHDLRFHKIGQDGSGKCDAFYTRNPDDYILGVLYEISVSDKRTLDNKEGLGYGYSDKNVTLFDGSGRKTEAFTYFATGVDPSLKPFSWYKQHVLKGAREASFPESYKEKIDAVKEIRDPDKQRAARQLSVYG
ncbi:MAG: gamma-glutamylcyclotransferase [Balneolaceae bacterium]|nr:MAG: gamma-glutamylcyclotransferase [Balneolaceae bacterium]